MDVIALHGLRAYGRHGTTEHERARPQPLDIDVEIEMDLQQASRGDRLADTLDYAGLHSKIVEIVTTTSFSLLERLGDEILAAIFGDPRVTAAQVRIAKPRLLDGATPSVQLRRRNSRHMPAKSAG